jgi:hypothetical protein
MSDNVEYGQLNFMSKGVEAAVGRAEPLVLSTLQIEAECFSKFGTEQAEGRTRVHASGQAHDAISGT